MVVGRAPGRLDVMGGIADYSGSLVLQWPTAAQATVSATWDDGERVVVTTSDGRAASGPTEVVLPLAALRGPYDEVRSIFTADTRWAAYVAASS